MDLEVAEANMTESQTSLVPLPKIARAIHVVRNVNVMLDEDLAAFYGVATGRLNERVRRSRERFPEDFMFTLTREEWRSLRSQSAISNRGRGGRRHLPLAFTEHGVIMLASVLSSRQAIETSVVIVRAFVQLRGLLTGQRQLVHKVDELERRLATHDKEIRAIVAAIKGLMTAPPNATRKIGFAAPPVHDRRLARHPTSPKPRSSRLWR
jgi:hypothetical protein